jgi:glycosyl hydrolase family 92/F5/8 type C domain-containing protein
MIGYHSVSVIADAMVKGIKGFDYEKAFEASKHSAMLDHLGLKAYKEKGFISMEDEHESVSKTVEYAYDDWCIAQMAKLLNKTTDYNYFMKRSQSWKNVFDPETGFMRPKKNGGWLTPFEPREVNNNFTEGNSWQYTFFVPHDIYGLKVMLGEGNDRYSGQKLDELFNADSKTTGREQADITGLIGQYAHGNEPSHHMAYLFNYWYKASKTQERVHEIVTGFYKPTPDGLIGNEDCGQMSAWYVLSSIGFYSICPGNTYYSIGTPGFKKVVFNLENKKRIIIKADNVSDKNIYIKNVEIYEKGVVKGNWDAPSLPIEYIQEPFIKDSTVLSFQMSAVPENWGYYDRLWNGLYSYQTAHPVPFSVVPVINTAGNIFRDTLIVEINSPGRILYSLDGKKYENYDKPFVIRKNEIVYAKAIDLMGLIGDSSETNIANYTSAVVTACLYKMPHPDWKIKIRSKYNPQYTAGGDEGLIDGLRGETNWRKGEWQGYQSQDFEAVIDLGKKQDISEYSAGFLQDSRSWILMPSKVEYYASADNKKFELIGTATHSIDPKDDTNQIRNFALSGKKVKARYIKVKAYNFGKLPEWHQGAGGDAFIFIDEISVK